MIFVGWKIACGWSYFCCSKNLIANLLPVKFERFEDRKSMDFSMFSWEETRKWKKKTFWFVVFYRFKMKNIRSASRSFKERNRRKSSEVTESCFQRARLSSIRRGKEKLFLSLHAAFFRFFHAAVSFLDVFSWFARCFVEICAVSWYVHCHWHRWRRIIEFCTTSKIK